MSCNRELVTVNQFYKSVRKFEVALLVNLCNFETLSLLAEKKRGWLCTSMAEVRVPGGPCFFSLCMNLKKKMFREKLNCRSFVCQLVFCWLS